MRSERAAPTPASNASAAPAIVSAPSASAPAAILPSPAEQLLAAWTAALNAADTTALEPLYADKVKFYGQSLSRAEVIARKRKALAAAPGFEQRVIGQPSYQDDGDSIRVGFQKRSGLPKALNDVRSTLVLAKAPRLAIREETDDATEKRFSHASDDAKPDSCEAAVWAVVDSTAFAKQLYATIDKNLKQFPASDDLNPGGMGPFLPSETGGTYDVWVGVHHPGRFENYAAFSVTPKGDISVNCSECEAPSGPIAPAPAARDDFARLCESH